MQKIFCAALVLISILCNHSCKAQGQTSVSSDATNIDFPENLHKSPSLTLKFIVDPSGNIRSMKIKRLRCKGCSQTFRVSLKDEGIRILKSMPPFKSSKQDVVYTIPLLFEIKE